MGIIAVVQPAASTRQYSKRYPEAVRSLSEDEEHLLTFYEFPQTGTDLFRPPMLSKAWGAS